MKKKINSGINEDNIFEEYNFGENEDVLEQVSCKEEYY